MVCVGERRRALYVWARGVMTRVGEGLLVPLVYVEVPGIGRDAVEVPGVGRDDRERRLSVRWNVRLMLSRVTWSLR